MVMQSIRRGRFGTLLKYMVFLILGLAVGGLVISGNYNTGSVASNDVARVEDRTISIRQFDRTLRRQLAQYGISTQQAYEMGVANEVLASEVRSLFILEDAQDYGVAIPQDLIARRIAEVVKPQQADDQTLQETLEALLRNQGLTERDFIEGIRREMSNDIVRSAIVSGFNLSADKMASDLYLFQEQTRDIDMIRFEDKDIDTIEEPTDVQLKTLYESLKSLRYTIPEYRSVDVVTFDPETIDVEFSVTEEEMRQVYDDNQENYALGEQYVLSQVVVKDLEQAQKIYDQAAADSNLKQAVTDVVGQSATYTENVSFETSLMLPDLAAALEGQEDGSVVGPVSTMLGHHVVRLEKTLPPSISPYEDVKDRINKELLEAKKIDHIYEMSTELDAMLSDGKPFEDIAKQFQIKVDAIDMIDANGINKDGKSGLESYKEEDRSMIAEAIFEVDDLTPPVLQELPSGVLVALKVKDVQEQGFKAYEDVKDEIQEQFIADLKRNENNERVKKMLAELETGGSSFDSLSKKHGKTIEKISGITIAGAMPSPLDESVRGLIFNTPLNGYNMINQDGVSALVKVSGYSLPDHETDEAKLEIESIKSNVSTQAKDEAFLMYVHMLSGKYNAMINERLLERAYGQSNATN